MKIDGFAWIMAFILLIPAGAFSHEHWIDAENFLPSEDDKVKIFICSGHNFPSSGLAISERILDRTEIIAPEGERLSLKTYEDKKKKCLVAGVLFNGRGSYLLTFYLQKAQMKRPLYCAKAIVLCGEQTGTEPSYISASPLEIIPRKDISGLKAGDKLPLELIFEGKVVKTTFHISINGKKNFHLRSRRKGAAVLKLSRKGRYLITASHEGIGCSLTFYIGGK